MEVILDVLMGAQASISKAASQEVALKDELASYQLVGRVTAYQGF